MNGEWTLSDNPLSGRSCLNEAAVGILAETYYRQRSETVDRQHWTRERPTEAGQFEELAQQWAQRGGLPTTWEQDLAEIALEYGDHKRDCAKMDRYYGHENDCTCGWGSTAYYLRVSLMKLENPLKVPQPPQPQPEGTNEGLQSKEEVENGQG